jgi:hypothetical protein
MKRIVPGPPQRTTQCIDSTPETRIVRVLATLPGDAKGGLLEVQAGRYNSGLSPATTRRLLRESAIAARGTPGGRLAYVTQAALTETHCRRRLAARQCPETIGQAL